MCAYYCWRSELKERSPEASASSTFERPLITLLIIPENTPSVSAGAGDSHPFAYSASPYATMATGSSGGAESTFRLTGARPVYEENADCSARLERSAATWYAPEEL